MATYTETIGTYSEIVAELALLANGYTVSKTRTSEPFDMKAAEPLTGAELKVQVKTIRKRGDRNNELVVYATNGSGQKYDQSDVDVFIGVLAEDGEAPRVFMFENRGIREYWATEAKASKRWVELPLAFNRELYKPKTESEAV